MQNKTKYKKFENNNLPTPFWNKERAVLEYVYNDEGEMKICDSLSSAIEDITYYGFYYSYNIRHKTIQLLDDGTYKEEVVIGHVHEHTFEDVIKDLYRAPEYFSIPEEDEIYYSKQELKYLKAVQKYLLFLGVKDKLDNTKDNKRYQNKRYKKYGRKPIYTLTEKALDDLLNNKRDFIICVYNPNWTEEKTYKPGEKTALARNEDGDFRFSFEVLRSEVQDADKYKKYIINDDIVNEGKVLIEYVKLLEIFKD